MDKKRARLGQLHLIKSLEKKFGDQVKKVQTPKTLAIQKLFKSRVRMLLYPVKYLGPLIANVTWELSKVNDGAHQEAILGMCCIIKYVLNIRNFGLS